MKRRTKPVKRGYEASLQARVYRAQQRGAMDYSALAALGRLKERQHESGAHRRAKATIPVTRRAACDCGAPINTVGKVAWCDDCGAIL